MSGSNPIIQGVYAFTGTITNGFQATITPLDENNQPFNTQGASCTMQLTRQSDNLVEFTWTTTKGNITFGPSGAIIVNIPGGTAITPSVWIEPDQQYPYQVYNYTFYLYDPTGIILVGFTGTFTIYQL